MQSSSRGVAKMAALAELTLPYLRVGGVLAAHKKDNVGPELAAAAKAVSLLGGAAPELRPVNAPWAGGRPGAGGCRESCCDAEGVPAAGRNAHQAAHRRVTAGAREAPTPTLPLRGLRTGLAENSFSAQMYDE